MIQIKLLLEDCLSIVSVLKNDMMTMSNPGLSVIYDILVREIEIEKARIAVEKARIQMKKARKKKNGK